MMIERAVGDYSRIRNVRAPKGYKALTLAQARKLAASKATIRVKAVGLNRYEGEYVFVGDEQKHQYGGSWSNIASIQFTGRFLGAPYDSVIYSFDQGDNSPMGFGSGFDQVFFRE